MAGRLAALRRGARRPGGRVVALVGEPGMGKTRCAEEIAAANAQRLGCGVAWGSVQARTGVRRPTGRGSELLAAGWATDAAALFAREPCRGPTRRRRRFAAVRERRRASLGRTAARSARSCSCSRTCTGPTARRSQLLRAPGPRHLRERPVLLLLTHRPADEPLAGGARAAPGRASATSSSTGSTPTRSPSSRKRSDGRAVAAERGAVAARTHARQPALRLRARARAGGRRRRRSRAGLRTIIAAPRGDAAAGDPRHARAGRGRRHRSSRCRVVGAGGGAGAEPSCSPRSSRRSGTACSRRRRRPLPVLPRGHARGRLRSPAERTARASATRGWRRSSRRGWSASPTSPSPRSPTTR